MTNSSLASRLNAIGVTGKFESQTLADFDAFLNTAPDEELFRMSPLRYAERSQVGNDVAIDLFLYATHAGILDFNWGVLCPSCGDFLSRESGLRWVHTNNHCSLCRLDTVPALEEQVEVAFTVSPSVRTIRFHHMDELEFERDGLFTFFSTSVVLHPEAHQVIYSSMLGGYRIPANTTREISLEFEPNYYVLMIPSTHAVAHIPVEASGTAHEVEFELLFDGQLVPEIGGLAPGKGLIRLRNRTSQAILIGLLRDQRLVPFEPEQRTGPLYSLTPYLTGHELINSQTFRDLFRAESIPPASGLEIRNLTLLFTDLKGSTAMYERIGYFNGYTLVREHFGLLRGIIAAQHGAIVKTMGDALMASFPDPASALEAAAVMRQEMRKAGSGEQLVLKIGVHSGPCIAVETIEHLDYIGQTVNVAARLQALADAGEIVCTEVVYRAPEVGAAIKRAGLKADQDQALLKGVGNPVTFFRLH